MKRIHLLKWVCGMIFVILTNQGAFARELSAAAGRDLSKKNASMFGEINSLAVNLAGRALFIGSQVGLFRSEDGGRSWRKVALPIKQASVKVTAVTPGPNDPNAIFVATRDAGLFKTQDGGRVWKPMNSGLRSLESYGLAVDVSRPNKIYAAIRETRDAIYRSTNGGDKWSRVDTGPDGKIKSLTSVNISSGAGGIFLYAVTSAGLQRSPDCF